MNFMTFHKKIFLYAMSYNNASKSSLTRQKCTLNLLAFNKILNLYFTSIDYRLGKNVNI